jgi:hypothetical protein
MHSHRTSLTLFYLLEPEQNVRDRAMPYIQNIQPGEKAGERFFTFIFKNN